LRKHEIQQIIIDICSHFKHFLPTTFFGEIQININGKFITTCDNYREKLDKYFKKSLIEILFFVNIRKFTVNYQKFNILKKS